MAVLLGVGGARAESTARFPDAVSASVGIGQASHVDTRTPSVTPARATPTSNQCTRSGILLWRARQRASRGDILQALTVYSRAIQLEPNCGAATVELARLRGGLGDYAEAERLYARAIRQREHRALAYRERAQLRRRQGRRAAALEDLQAAISLEADDLESIRTLANWYIEERAWSAALAQYRAIVRLLSQRGTAEALRQARVQQRALALMAAETDPVLDGGDSDNWIRQSMSKLAAAQPNERD